MRSMPSPGDLVGWWRETTPVWTYPAQRPPRPPKRSGGVRLPRVVVAKSMARPAIFNNKLRHLCNDDVIPLATAVADAWARTFASTCHLRFACYYIHKRGGWVPGKERGTDGLQSLDAGVGRSLRLRGLLRLRGGGELTLTPRDRNGRTFGCARSASGRLRHDHHCPSCAVPPTSRAVADYACLKTTVAANQGVLAPVPKEALGVDPRATVWSSTANSMSEVADTFTREVKPDPVVMVSPKPESA